MTTALKLTIRKSAARGNADHGWLKSYHTFSFASYQENKFDQFGPLRVINEDRVAPATGFGTHSHANFEIWSYLVEGELEHKDSLGNTEIMKQDEVQMTSTGKGISHSEYNRNSLLPVHFLQIWALPSTRNTPPKYYNRTFPREEKLNKLAKIVGPLGGDTVDVRESTGPAPVNSPLSMFASILSTKLSVSHTLSPLAKRAYLHLIMKSGYRARKEASDAFEDGGAKIRVNGITLEEGDGLFVDVVNEGGELKIENVGERESEFLLFEMYE